MTFSELEVFYEALAPALDQAETVGPAARELFLCKLALSLANELPDAKPALDAITTCLKSLCQTD